MANHAQRFSGNCGIKLLSIVLMTQLSGCALVHFGAEVPCDEWKKPSEAAHTKRDDGDLHVITWNLHGMPFTGDVKARLGRVTKELRYRGSDLLLFQEVWFDGDAKVLESALSEEYERIPDDLNVSSGILNLLGGFRNGGLLAFIKKVNEKVSGWTARVEPSTFSEYKLAAPKRRFLNEGDGISGKGIQRFVLSIKNSPRKVQIFNTHLQSQYGDGRRYVQIRKAQIDELTKLADSENDANQELVTQLVFGDFNTFPTERALYKKLTEKWSDLTSHFREECNCGTSLDVDEDPQDGTPIAIDAEWIDYALARRDTNVKVVDAWRIPSSDSKIDCPFSDHYGLELLLRIGD